MSVGLNTIVRHLDELLGIEGHPDYPVALNGLQVDGPAEVARVCSSVDASEAAIEATAAAGGNLLVVHHGLFWDGLKPMVGRRRRKLELLLSARIAVYSAHLPLDAHADFGNCVLLLRALGIHPRGRFGRYQGADVGWWGEAELSRDALLERTAAVLGGPVRLLGAGPERTRRIGVLTGSGAVLDEAARTGLDTLITGEGPHHAAIDANELGLNLIYGGHYATETFGVRALGDLLAARFGVEHRFLDLPTGT